VDTNVLVVANEKNEHAGPECIIACVKALEDVKQRRITLLDSGMRIFNEYNRYATLAGQPGLGDSFFKWLWTNQVNPKHCLMVDITPSSGDPDDFEEFPNDPSLASFDRSDRTFVAVALAGQRAAKVFNAADTDWWHYRNALRNHGLVIEFLCPDLMT